QLLSIVMATSQQGKESEDNCIRLSVMNPANLKTTGVFSPVKIISNFLWKMKVEEKSNSLSVFLHCEQGQESNVWFCETSLEYSLVNQDDPMKSIKQTSDYRYGSHVKFSGWGFSSFLEMSTILDEYEGFIKEDSIVVEIRVIVKSKSGDRFRKKPESTSLPHLK
ncbi:hypothetical protein PFISCL1PPCAC_20268, partial [Pristionchus fissidentatus]